MDKSVEAEFQLLLEVLLAAVKNRPNLAEMIKTIEFDGFDKIYFKDRTVAAQ